MSSEQGSHTKKINYEKLNKRIEEVNTCTSNPCAHACSMRLCNLDMLGTELRGGL